MLQRAAQQIADVARNAPLRAAIECIEEEHPEERTHSPLALSPGPGSYSLHNAAEGKTGHREAERGMPRDASLAVWQTVDMLRALRDQHDPRSPAMWKAGPGGHLHSSSVTCPRCRRGRATAVFHFGCGRTVSLCRSCGSSFCTFLSEKIFLLSSSPAVGSPTRHAPSPYDAPKPPPMLYAAAGERSCTGASSLRVEIPSSRALTADFAAPPICNLAPDTDAVAMYGGKDDTAAARVHLMETPPRRASMPMLVAPIHVDEGDIVQKRKRAPEIRIEEEEGTSIAALPCDIPVEVPCAVTSNVLWPVEPQEERGKSWRDISVVMDQAQTQVGTEPGALDPQIYARDFLAEAVMLLATQDANTANAGPSVHVNILPSTPREMIPNDDGPARNGTKPRALELSSASKPEARTSAGLDPSEKRNNQDLKKRQLAHSNADEEAGADTAASARTPQSQATSVVKLLPQKHSAHEAKHPSKSSKGAVHRERAKLTWAASKSISPVPRKTSLLHAHSSSRAEADDRDSKANTPKMSGNGEGREYELPPLLQPPQPLAHAVNCCISGKAVDRASAAGASDGARGIGLDGCSGLEMASGSARDLAVPSSTCISVDNIFSSIRDPLRVAENARSSEQRNSSEERSSTHRLRARGLYEADTATCYISGSLNTAASKQATRGFKGEQVEEVEEAGRGEASDPVSSAGLPGGRALAVQVCSCRVGSLLCQRRPAHCPKLRQPFTLTL